MCNLRNAHEPLTLLAKFLGVGERMFRGVSKRLWINLKSFTLLTPGHTTHGPKIFLIYSYGITMVTLHKVVLDWLSLPNHLQEFLTASWWSTIHWLKDVG